MVCWAFDNKIFSIPKGELIMRKVKFFRIKDFKTPEELENKINSFLVDNNAVLVSSESIKMQEECIAVIYEDNSNGWNCK